MTLNVTHNAIIADRQNRPRLTPRVLIVLCSISLIDAINFNILKPYVVAMASTILHKPRGDPSVAMFVSILIGSYSICEGLFSGFWGMLSDRIGRRPVLLIGLAGSTVAPILLGFSTSVQLALGARLMDGFFCGNASTIRTYLGEVVDASNEARAFGSLALTYSVGMVIGPLLGGLVSEPAQSFPMLFEGTVFDYYPYLLPNVAFASLALAALLIGACALEETKHAGRQVQVNTRETLISGAGDRALQAPATWSPRLIYAVVAMSLLYGYAAMRIQSFILVTALPRNLDGFALGPKEVGSVQTFAAFFTWFTQIFLYERGMKKFGPHSCFMAGMGFTVLLSLPFPAYCLLADPAQFGSWRYVPIFAYHGISQIGFSFAFPTSYLLVNRECQTQNRGAVNGWAHSCSAFSRGVFPFVGGVLFRWGTDFEGVGLPGARYLSLYVACIMGLVSIWVLAVQRNASQSTFEHRMAELPNVRQEGDIVGDKS